jgi:outer membrane protein TolC
MRVEAERVTRSGGAGWCAALLGLVVLAALARTAPAQQFRTDLETADQGVPMEPLFSGPVIVESRSAPPLQPAAPERFDRPLPINLATALCLSQARPLIIALAQASIERAAADLDAARALWLPDLHFGAGYSHHDGANQGTDGNVQFASFGSFYGGGGATLDFGVTDALFRPLAAQQQLVARQQDAQAACNDALLAAANSYFDVQEARGRLAGHLDTAAKAVELLRRVESLAQGLVPEAEVDRARATVADLDQQAVASRIAWRVASARLTRTLRLVPGSVVIPLEPPHLQVTLISFQYPVDDLVRCGLTNRPELAAQKALVQATLELLRQEQLRPLLPSVVLSGCGPDGAVLGGVFGGGTDGRLNTWGGQAEFDVGVVWTLQNLGLGNRALVRGREADRQKALIELFDLQDRVADEVVRAHAEAHGTRVEIADAETAVREANITFAGSLNGLLQIRGAGNFLQPVSRPQEVVAALQQLNGAYDKYFSAVADYNRAQFQLYHALGYPSRILACGPPAAGADASPAGR